MKRLVAFLLGFATMVMVFGAIYVAASIYDTNEKFVVEPRFLRTSVQSNDLPGMPHPWSQVRKRRLRDWLIQKYVTEYFYIIPDQTDLERRAERKNNSVLSIMSSPEAFDYWKKNYLPKMRELVKNGARRTVAVFDQIYKPSESDYWRVEYELKTWYKPNDMSENPTITRGTMYIDLGDEERIRHIGDIKEGNVQDALLRGIDPAVVFFFQAQRVVVEEK